MRTKIHKMNADLFATLKRIDDNIDEAVRVLLKTIYNEALVMYNEKFIKYQEALYQKNLKTMEEIPNSKKRAMNNLREALLRKLEDSNKDLEIIELKLKYNRIITPMREYESLPEWESLEKDELNREKDRILQKKIDIENSLVNLDKTFEDAIEYENQYNELVSQNERIKVELERARKILSIQEMLKVKNETN